MAISFTREIPIGAIAVGGDSPLAVIAGPCVIENQLHVLKIAGAIKEIAGGLGLPWIFKASYDKANRSSIKSFRGPGVVEGLRILAGIRQDLGCPVMTDVHSVSEVSPAAQSVDLLQIPAFLCRQTDLIVAAAKSGKAMNVKKGQFLAPWDVKNIIDKVESSGCTRLLLTERGTQFGYNNLISDMRALMIMREYGYPVVYDATHSVQLPGGQGESSGGQREFVAPLARAAVATGVDAIFLEVHDKPEAALSDGPNSLRLDDLERLLQTLKKIDDTVKG